MTALPGYHLSDLLCKLPNSKQICISPFYKFGHLNCIFIIVSNDWDKYLLILLVAKLAMHYYTKVLIQTTILPQNSTHISKVCSHSR